MHDYRTLFEALVLYAAVVTTMQWIMQCLVFCVTVLNKHSSNIKWIYSVVPAALWAMLFWLMRASL